MAMLPSTGITLLDIALFALGCYLVDLLIKRRVPKGLRLPPGPPRLPIIGSVTNRTAHCDWKTIAQLSKEYGDLVYLELWGKPIIVVNNFETASELFDKRSSIYSDRPNFTMLMLLGWDFNIGFMRHGLWWRRHRRTFHQYFNQKASEAHHPIQEKHARSLLHKLHDSPDEFVEHLRHLAGAIIMEVVYGMKLKPKGDHYIEIAHKALVAAAEAANFGTFFVDFLPILRYVPEWIPGAGFKKKARLGREPTVEINVMPYMKVKQDISNGQAEHSVMRSWLDNLYRCSDAPADEECVIRNTGGMTYAAGGGTSVTALITFVHAMVLHPDAQRKAQEELDAVIGDRLPTIKDRTQLPYVSALCLEMQRWRPVLPLAVAHALLQDDVYGNYFIPKGSVVIGNSWTILHDEARYGHRPEKFEPERFLQPGVQIPTAHYGFGRRICPGRHMASSTLWIMAASILKVFDITLARDSKGKEIMVADAYTPGILMQPEPFQCSITPRSAAAKRLIPERLDD